MKRQLAWMFCAEDSPANPSPAPGEGGGLADERWLWPEYARIVEALEPAIVVCENVPPLRRAGLPHVLADLARLGFDAEWVVNEIVLAAALAELDKIGGGS